MTGTVISKTSKKLDFGRLPDIEALLGLKLKRVTVSLFKSEIVIETTDRTFVIAPSQDNQGRLFIDLISGDAGELAGQSVVHALHYEYGPMQNTDWDYRTINEIAIHGNNSKLWVCFIGIRDECLAESVSITEIKETTKDYAI